MKIIESAAKSKTIDFKNLNIDPVVFDALSNGEWDKVDVDSVRKALKAIKTKTPIAPAGSAHADIVDLTSDESKKIIADANEQFKYAESQTDVVSVLMNLLFVRNILSDFTGNQKIQFSSTNFQGYDDKKINAVKARLAPIKTELEKLNVEKLTKQNIKQIINNIRAHCSSVASAALMS